MDFLRSNSVAYLDQEYYMITLQERPPAKSNMYGVRCVGKLGVIYTKKELEDYELKIGALAEKVIPHVLDGYHAIFLRIYQYGKKFIDVDNTFKATQDGIDNGKKIKKGKKEIQICKTGIRDDKYFQLIAGERVFVDTKEEERIEVIITKYKGIIHLSNLIQKIYGLNEDYYLENIKFLE